MTDPKPDIGVWVLHSYAWDIWSLTHNIGIIDRITPTGMFGVKLVATTGYLGAVNIWNSENYDRVAMKRPHTLRADHPLVCKVLATRPSLEPQEGEPE